MATSIQTCYRHDDRRAGVICQRCDRPICPDCMSQASVGFHCPECTKAGAQKTISAIQLQQKAAPVVTVVLIAINVAVFIIEPFVSTRIGRGMRVAEPIGVEGGFPVIDDAFKQFGVLYGPNVAAGDWWRTITSGFLHADILHLGMNMLLLYLLGQMLEPALDRLGLLSLYAMSLMGGSFAVLLISPDQTTVGASGAVFGLMAAAFVGLRSRGINPFNTVIGPLLVLNVVFSFAPGISLGGHFGGLAAGAAGGWLLFELAPRLPAGRTLMPLACAGIAVALFLVGLSLPGAGPVLAPVLW